MTLALPVRWFNWFFFRLLRQLLKLLHNCGDHSSNSSLCVGLFFRAGTFSRLRWRSPAVRSTCTPFAWRQAASCTRKPWSWRWSAQPDRARRSYLPRPPRRTLSRLAGSSITIAYGRIISVRPDYLRRTVLSLLSAIATTAITITSSLPFIYQLLLISWSPLSSSSSSSAIAITIQIS